MSVEFRQRTPAEYARIVWRRKWLIVLPTLVIALAIGWVVLRLPDTYESTTLLTVRPATISTSIVPQLSDKDLTIRINNIGQEVTSRSSLEPMIERYNLYAAERSRGEPMDALVERMRTRDIYVKINTTRNDITNGFFLSFRGPDPRSTQAVTSELAGKYINAQTKTVGEEAKLTKEFFEEKLRLAKDELDAIDRQRLQFMSQNVEHLPSSEQSLVGRLTGLYEQQKAYLTETGRLRDQIASAHNMLSSLRKLSEQEKSQIAENVTDPKTTLGWAELVKRKSQLESDLKNLLARYRPKHPDVLAKQSELDAVQRQMDGMVAEWKERIREKEEKLKRNVDPRIYTSEEGIRRAEAELHLQQKLLAQTTAQIAQLEQRLSNVPGTSVGLSAIEREYQSKKGVYDELLKQKERITLGADVVASQQGETITVIDPANLPEQPVAPNRPMLLLFGLLLGAGVGLAFAALFEVPRLLTVQTREDAEHYTGLPVLITVPSLLTPREQRRAGLRRTALALAGVVTAIVSVPALALLLKVTRVIEMFASRG